MLNIMYISIGTFPILWERVRLHHNASNRFAIKKSDKIMNYIDPTDNLLVLNSSGGS